MVSKWLVPLALVGVLAGFEATASSAPPRKCAKARKWKAGSAKARNSLGTAKQAKQGPWKHAVRTKSYDKACQVSYELQKQGYEIKLVENKGWYEVWGRK